MAVLRSGDLDAGLPRMPARPARGARPREQDAVEALAAAAVRRGYATRERIQHALDDDLHLFDDGAPVHAGERLVRAGVLNALQVASLLAEKAPGYRLLEDSIQLATLLRSSLRGERRSVMVAGLASRSGSSAVLAGVAVALSLMFERRCVLVDCDTAHPSLHQLFDVPQQAGAPRRTGLPGLLVAPCEQSAAGAPTLIDEASLARLLAAGGPEVLTLVSAPPLLGNALTLTLASHTEATLLVAPAQGCRRSELAEATRLLGLAGASVLGVVATRDGR